MEPFFKVFVLNQILAIHLRNIGHSMDHVTIFCNPSLDGRILLIKEYCQMLTSMVCNLFGSDLGGVINIADPVTGSFVFIKLGYLKNFRSNKCGMKCLQD